jgi:hypothetical protein
MQYITEEEFKAWKNQASTRKIADVINNYLMQEYIALGKRAGKDPLDDRFHSGVLEGIQRAWDLDLLFAWTQDKENV